MLASAARVNSLLSSRQGAKEGRPSAEYQLVAQPQLLGPDDPLEVALGAPFADGLAAQPAVDAHARLAQGGVAGRVQHVGTCAQVAVGVAALGRGRIEAYARVLVRVRVTVRVTVTVTVTVTVRVRVRVRVR